MKRSVKHKTVLNRIIRDERLSPNRRLLGEMLALWLDSESSEQKERLLKLIESQFGDPRRTYWGEPEDKNRKSTISEAEQEATDKLKNFFAAAQEGIPKKLREETSEIFEPKLDNGSQQ